MGRTYTIQERVKSLLTSESFCRRFLSFYKLLPFKNCLKTPNNDDPGGIPDEQALVLVKSQVC